MKRGAVTVDVVGGSMLRLKVGSSSRGPSVEGASALLGLTAMVKLRNEMNAAIDQVVLEAMGHLNQCPKLFKQGIVIGHDTPAEGTRCVRLPGHTDDCSHREDWRGR